MRYIQIQHHHMRLLFQYAPIFEQLLLPRHLSKAEKVISPELFG